MVKIGSLSNLIKSLKVVVLKKLKKKLYSFKVFLNFYLFFFYPISMHTI